MFGDNKMESKTTTHFYAWMDDDEMPVNASVTVSHKSTQVAGKPEYVADVCDRFGAEKSDEQQKSCVIRGYN
jgi:hypothetical protein